MNEVKITGTLVRDTEIKTYSNEKGDGILCPFQILNTDGRKSYIDVIVFGDDAELLRDKTKGTEVYVAGAIQQNRWQKDGEWKSKIQIVASDIRVKKVEPEGDVPF
jgi:single-stranded DNA-binding protein